MPQSETIKIGGFSLPITADSLKDLKGGQTVTLEPIVFNFEFRHIKFKCTCDDDAMGDPIFCLSGRLGAIPFTAESPYARMAAITIANAAERHLDGAIQIANGHITVTLKKKIASPVTATSLVSSIVVTLTKLAPYLSLLGEIVRPPNAGKPTPLPS